MTGVAVTNVDVIYKPRDISNIGYNSITGISTVTTAFDHGLTKVKRLNYLELHLLVIMLHH